MRDRRLWCVAVLAAALAFTSALHAADDTAVVTLIVDPQGADPNTWQLNIRLLGYEGVGSAAGLGFLDFVINPIAATGWTVTDTQNVAPSSAMQNGGSQTAIGFDPAWELPADMINGITGKQNTEYADGDYPTDPGNNMPAMDAAILTGIGKSAGTFTAADVPSGWTLIGSELSWQADTNVAVGAYVTNGVAGSLNVLTFGTRSFCVLPNYIGDGDYYGPTNDLSRDGNPTSSPPLPSLWVNTVVTQVMTGGTGNDGGTAGYDRETALTVVQGPYTMTLPTLATDPAYVRAVVEGSPGTFLILGASQNFLSLTLNYAADGDQGLDLRSPAGSGQYNALRIFAGDAAALAAAEQAVIDAIKWSNANDPNPANRKEDGIFDSNLHAGAKIGVTDHPTDGGSYVLVRATIDGDINCDGIVNLGDFLVWQNNLWKSGFWDDGDITGDDVVNLGDFLAWQNNLWKTYSPEPTSVCLLALASLTLLRRRRGSK